MRIATLRSEIVDAPPKVSDPESKCPKTYTPHSTSAADASQSSTITPYGVSLPSEAVWSHAVNLPLAVILPCALWAFSHHPGLAYPMYFRATWLIGHGLLLLVVSLKWGVVTAVAAHYTYNAAVTSAPLLRSGDAAIALSAGVVIALPLVLAIPGIVSWLRHRHEAAPYCTVQAVDGHGHP